MKPCSCGKEVRLRAIPIRVNRKLGVMHWIEHMDGSKVCREGLWQCAMVKPYPPEEERDRVKMVAKWDAFEQSRNEGLNES